ncbi:MAG: hypothetical protein GXY33_04180 [Phycisphaerae bacterium]|nr:hypothetical protein [Phycisphaerae bacterium]
MNREYYQHPAIADRIREYAHDAVFISTGEPSLGYEHRCRGPGRVAEALASGDGIYRSILDYSRVIFAIDLEYGNRTFPGEIFHEPLTTFQKIEPTRLAIRDVLSRYGVAYLELMTGQGYHFVAAIERSSSSYQALLRAAGRLAVLPATAAARLIGTVENGDSAPVVRDASVFLMLGHLADYIFDRIRLRTELLLRTSDVYDRDQIIIFDSTLYGYLITQRSTRCVFSLHRKPLIFPIYEYRGPPLVAIPTAGLDLRQCLEIRADDRGHYQLAAELAARTTTAIPSADFTRLLGGYLTSGAYRRHRRLAEQLQDATVENAERAAALDLIRRDDPEITDPERFWGPLAAPDWASLYRDGLSEQSAAALGRPNDLLLKPTHLRHLIRELTDHGCSAPQIIAVIAEKYRSDYNWQDDLSNNDPYLRAEYWLRTLSQQF